MRVAVPTLALLSLVGGAQAFSVVPAANSFMALSMSDAVAEAPVEEAVEEEEAAPVVAEIPKSGLTMHQVRRQIAKMDSSSFSSSLDTLEPFLLNEAGATFYAKCMKRIAQKAKELEVALPENYALEARATSKRRAKQNEFIAAKQAEAAEAAEAAAEEEGEQ